MFYPVRVLTKKGKLKKVVPSKALSQNYWDKVFDPTRKNIQLSVRGISKKDREALGWEADKTSFSED